eukprot:1157257-Pelagomonas_calceolata.AAC.7
MTARLELRCTNPYFCLDRPLRFLAWIWMRLMYQSLRIFGMSLLAQVAWLRIDARFMKLQCSGTGWASLFHTPMSACHHTPAVRQAARVSKCVWPSGATLHGAYKYV